MSFVVVFCLVAVAAADTQIDNDLPMLHVLKEGKVVPHYLLSPAPEPLREYVKKGRFVPNFGESKKNDYFLPYFYKKDMAYPVRSNYFLRYLSKPELIVPQPKISYDSENYIHQHDVNHKHIVNNIHDIKEHNILRTLEEDSKLRYLSFSPMYNENHNTFYRGYPQWSSQYSRSLEYIQPRTNRYWDLDDTKEYYDVISRRNLYKNLGLDYVQPATSDEYVYPVIPKNLNVDYIQPVIPKDSRLGRNLETLVATKIKMSHQTPTTGHHEIVSQAHDSITVPWDNRRQDTAEMTALQAEDHISQLPMNRLIKAISPLNTQPSTTARRDDVPSQRVPLHPRSIIFFLPNDNDLPMSSEMNLRTGMKQW